MESDEQKIVRLEKELSDMTKKFNDLAVRHNQQTFRVERLEGEREGWGDAFKELADKLIDKIS